MKQLSLVIAVGIAIAVGSSVLAFISVPSSIPKDGTLTGTVNIGPLCPVEPCSNPPPDIYSSRQLILHPQYGQQILIPLRADGSFQAKVRAGTYTVDLTNCTFLGCKNSLPLTVTIEGSQTTILNISIDTGIR